MFSDEKGHSFMKNIPGVTLEVSLKPFRQTDPESIRRVCRDIFLGWRPLLVHADCVSVLLWCSDGSEILEYTGDRDASFEWAYLIGTANGLVEPRHSDLDPEGKGLHTRPYLYMKHPPLMTYRILSDIVAALKEEGQKILGADKTIRVGETFDIGPEFAVSDFKYRRHNEICTGNGMGKNSTISANTTLHADRQPYAAFPDGIPEGTPFGTFFGRQCRVFLTDLGFDYIWFSNGLGFGREVWSARGAVFDGERFHTEELERVKEEVVRFWSLFRAACDFPIETRGTNFSVGIDCATDGVPLKTIYDTVPDLLPPPNSPWAALDGDFGLELMGYMSRMAEVPGDRYLFRYYIHDPWWMNSPWYDRYNSQPHDIYLPLACARIDREGKVKIPTNMNLLSIDNSFGEMPDCCINETIPHLLRGFKEAPDAPAPAVWVYPFAEYAAAHEPADVQAMYGEDWYIRGAINYGLPLSSVTSTDSFLVQDKTMYRASVLVTPVPYAKSAFEAAILAYAKNGGKVIFYGSQERGSRDFRDFFALHRAEPRSGELPLTVDGDRLGTIKHVPILSGGELTADSDRAYATLGGRAFAVRVKNAIWLRGSVSAELGSDRLPVPHDETHCLLSETYLRDALTRLGWEVRLVRHPGTEYPKMMLHRHDNAYIFSVYTPSTTVATRLRFPLGAPILDGYDAEVVDGYATYHFPKADRRECRFFIEQESGVVGVKEMQPVSAYYRRRIEIHGLQDATVRFFPETYATDKVRAVLNPPLGYDAVELSDPFDGGVAERDGLTYYEARHVTGFMVFSLPFREGESPAENDGYLPKIK